VGVGVGTWRKGSKGSRQDNGDSQLKGTAQSKALEAASLCRRDDGVMVHRFGESLCATRKRLGGE
jgi:hypothetical protein